MVATSSAPAASATLGRAIASSYLPEPSVASEQGAADEAPTARGHAEEPLARDGHRRPPRGGRNQYPALTSPIADRGRAIAQLTVSAPPYPQHRRVAVAAARHAAG